MKKIILLLACFAMLFSITGCSEISEKKAMNYYNKHISELKNNIERHFEKGEDLYAPGEGVTIDEWDGEHTIVEYIFSGNLTVPQYYGFFFSQDNVPVSYQNAGINMTAISENEWEWHEGGNNGYVRRIEPYWFYFEANF